MANFNLNKVILGGRLTADPELKQTPQGVSVTSFSVAINRRGKEQQADFINCIAWRQTAEIICKFFKKGSSICIVGNIQVRTWNDNNGNKRYATEVIADEVHFVDSRDEQSAAQGAPTFTTAQAPQFEEISPEDDLPF